MTEAQWYALHGEITATKILLFALAKTFPNQVELRAAFSEQKELFDTASLHSQLPDKEIQAQQEKIRQMEYAIWG